MGQVEDIFSDNTSNKAFKNLYKKEKPDENDPIIFFCKIGRRSGMAAEKVLKLGFKK